MIRKKLSDIAWNVTEEVYRADKAISYSKLSDFLRNGPQSLITNEKKDSPALRFGSLVDCILTAPEEFDDRFYVADIDSVGDKIRAAVSKVFEQNSDVASLEEVPNLLEYIELEDWQSNWKPETKLKKFIEGGSDFFTVLKYSVGKTIVTVDEFASARQCVSTLKSHPFTYKIFDLTENEEIFYQLKFKNVINGISARCMFDILKINHLDKTVEPIDLKTSGKSEEDFCKSFVDWNYWIQAAMYSELVRMAMDADDYFKDFELLSFKFCVINKMNLKPLIWDSIDEDGIIAEKLSDMFHTTWYDLLEDVHWHYDNNKFDYSRHSYENKGCNPIVDQL